MKKRISAFALAAVAACVPVKAMAQSSDFGFAPMEKITLFSQVASERPAGLNQFSTNGTGIATFDFTLNSNLRFTLGQRVDWVTAKPGFFGSEYYDTNAASVTWTPAPWLEMTAGTLPYIGPLGSEPSLTKWTQIERGFLGLGFGGPQPGLVGFDARFKGAVNYMPYTLESFAGTGDHYISTPELGANFPVRCGNSNDFDCGLVAGTNFAISPFAGLGLNGQVISIGNGGALRDETRINLGAKYEAMVDEIDRKFGPVKVGGMISGNFVNNYMGTSQNLYALTGTVWASKDLNPQWAIDGYLSATHAQFTVPQLPTTAPFSTTDYYLAGVGLTYHLSSDKTLVFTPYVGTEVIHGIGGPTRQGLIGAWFSYIQTFDFPIK